MAKVVCFMRVTDDYGKSLDNNDNLLGEVNQEDTIMEVYERALEGADSSWKAEGVAFAVRGPSHRISTVPPDSEVSKYDKLV